MTASLPTTCISKVFAYEPYTRIARTSNLALSIFSAFLSLPFGFYLRCAQSCDIEVILHVKVAAYRVTDT